MKKYQSPEVIPLAISPARIVCGSNEKIDPGQGDQSWVQEMDELFDATLLF